MGEEGLKKNDWMSFCARWGAQSPLRRADNPEGEGVDRTESGKLDDNEDDDDDNIAHRWHRLDGIITDLVISSD